MKITTLFLFIVLMQVSAIGYAQKKQVSLNLKNVSIEQLIDAIKKESGYKFVYRADLFEDEDAFDLKVNNKAVDEILNEVLINNGFEYEMVDDMIIVRKAPEVITIPEQQEEKKITITGTIKDEKGEPLPFAAICLKGTTSGCVSAVDGTYNIEIPANDEDVVLVISSLGFKTQQINVAGRTIVDITMQPDMMGLDEVVVTGYQTLSRERSAGSFAKVGILPIVKRNNLNIVETIKGTVPGVQVDDNGEIVIRGKSTINANSKPLIVVNGFPTDRELSDIDVNNIASITFLKDASAASIWGVRAANGVIVVETLRGGIPEKIVKVDFNSGIVVTGTPDLNDLPYANSASLIEYEQHLIDNNLIFQGGGLPVAISQYSQSVLDDPSIADELAQRLSKINSYNQFEDLFMRPAVKQNYNLSLRSGGTRSQQRFSVSYENSRDHFVGKENKRYDIDFYQNYQYNDKLSFNVGINYAHRENEANGLTYTHLRSLPRYQEILNEDGEQVPMPYTYAQSVKDDFEAKGYPYNWDYNLQREQQNLDNTQISRRVTVNTNIKYEITNDLSLNLGYNFERNAIKDHVFNNEDSYYVRNYVNSSTKEDFMGLSSAVPEGGILNTQDIEYKAYTYRGTATYNKQLNEKNYLAVFGGVEVRETENSSIHNKKYGYDERTLQEKEVDFVSYHPFVDGFYQKVIPAPASSYVLDRFVSYFGNFGYTYNDKYTINGSARLDKTNLFGKSDKYNNVWLWSVGGSWQLHKEAFMENAGFDNFNLKLSYGFNGNVDTSTSPHLVATIDKNFFNGLTYAAITNPANPLLRWEKTRVVNLGADIAFFNNRVSTTLNVYHKKSTDLLGNASTNGTYGFESAFLNYGSMENKGIDISIAAQVLNGKFGWLSSLTYSHNKNEVTDVELPQNTAISYLTGVPIVGQPLDHLHAYRWANLSSTGAPQVYNENNEVVDHTVHVESSDAVKYMGTTTPVHFGGFTNEFTYGDIGLIVNVTYDLGHKFRVPTINYYTSIGNPEAFIHKDWDKRWQKPNDENTTDVAAAPTAKENLYTYNQYMEYGDHNVQSASRISLDEIVVYYMVPAKVLSKIFVRDLMISFKARNIARYHFNDAGLDPSFLSDYGRISPVQKPEYQFSLKATF